MTPAQPDSAGLARLSAINAALRQYDPEAQVALDPDGDKVQVLTVLPADEVLRLLQALGEAVELPAGDEARAAAGGSCGCGCRQR